MSIADKIQRLTTAKTAIANAIAAKGGTVASGDGYEDFARDIATIPTGGGGGEEEIPRKDVNFVDYDGKVIAAYTLAEAQALSEYPSHPSHTGLTNDGWSRSLAFINALDYPLDIVARYQVTDGKLHIFYDASEKKTVGLKYLVITETVTATVDWGDENTSNVSVSRGNGVSSSHTYSSGGIKEIKISLSSNTAIANPSIDGNGNGILCQKNAAFVNEVWLPSWVLLGQLNYSYQTSPFGDVRNLLIDSRCTWGEYPNGIFASSLLKVADGGNRTVVSLARALGPFGSAPSKFIRSIDYPTFSYSSSTIVGIYLGVQCDVRYLRFPEGYNYFNSANSYLNAMALVMDFPSSTVSLGASFSTCVYLNKIICRATTPPSLPANAFLEQTRTNKGAIDFVIKVPASAVATYKAATNWSDYSSYIEAI